MAMLLRCGAASGIRRGFPLANSAGTYEFAREDPATSRNGLAPPVARQAGRDLASE